MNNKPLKIYLSSSTLSTLKKRAVLEGKRFSEFGRDLIESALSGGTRVEPAPVHGISLEAGMGSLPQGEAVLSPEALRYLVQDMAKTAGFVRQISLRLAEGKPKEHETSLKVAEGKARDVLKELNLDGVRDVDPFILKETPPEETEELFRKMGIVEGGPPLPMEG
ncbi:hypothetical protein ACSYAY_01190 [Leptospirillum ferriphilum]|nr:hypothetical protein [Leptospirillum ferriphilum]